MNWLGAGLPSFLAALVGALVGAFLHVEGLRRGIDAPPLVALLSGTLAAFASRERSGLRGVLVASLAVWAAALAEVWTAPVHGLARDVLDFHTRLGGVRFALYAATAVLGFLLAPRAWSPFRGSGGDGGGRPAASVPPEALASAPPPPPERLSA